MKLHALTFAELIRDGGSYAAQFTTDDGLEYSLWLQRHGFGRSGQEPRHRFLFEYRGATRSPDCVPVVTGSDQEQAIIRRLRAFLDEAAARQRATASCEERRNLQRLTEMLEFIARRGPCFPSDLRAAGFLGDG